MKAAFVPEKNEPPEDGGRWPREPLGPRLLRQHHSEDPRAWCPLRAMGAAQGKKVGAPEGPAGALDTGREAARARWEPSPSARRLPGASARHCPPASLPELTAKICI